MNEYVKFGKVIIKAKILSFLKPLLPLFRIIPILKDKVQERENKRNVIVETLKQGYEKNVATEADIQEIYKRIKPIVYGQKV